METGVKRAHPDDFTDDDIMSEVKLAKADPDSDMTENNGAGEGAAGEGSGEAGNEYEEDFTVDDLDDCTTGETDDGWQTYVAPSPPRGGFRGGMRGGPRWRPPPPWAMRGFRGMRPPPGMRPGMFPRFPPPPGFRGRGPMFRPPMMPRPQRPPPPNPENMTTEEKFDYFSNFLRNLEKDRAPPVTILANACVSSKLNIKLDYDGHQVEQVAGGHMFTGALKILDHFIARSIGSTKREVKQDVHKKAMEVLTSKTAEEVMALEDPGHEQLKREMEEQIQAEASRDLANLVNIAEAPAKPCTDPDVLGPLEKVANLLKIQKLYLDHECISLLESAIMQVSPRPDHEFIVEELRLVNGKNFYVGQLRFGPLIIGRGNGFNKKLCKTDTYKKCWNHLITKSLSELRVSMPAEEGKIEIETMPSHIQAKTKALSPDQPLSERFEDFFTTIAKADEHSCMKALDVAAAHAALKITVLYKAKHQNHLHPAMECDLFLEEIWITYHTGSTKRDCLSDIYRKAWKILCTKKPRDLMNMQRKLTKNDLLGPYMVSVYRKGVGNAMESNATHLKRYGHDLSKLHSNRLEDIVILEHTDWSQNREKRAIETLQLTCMINGMLLQWELEMVPNNVGINSRCKVYIQKQMMGNSLGIGKAQAKELAYKEALYKLYESKPVVRMNLEADQKEWITNEQLVKEANEFETRKVSPDLPVRDELNAPISGFLIKAAYERVKRFAEKKKGEIIFAPGFTADEGKELRYIGRMLSLKCDMRVHNEKQYIVLFKHIEWSKLVNRLSPTAGLYGKYFRVAKEDIPKFATIEKQIMKELPEKKPEEKKEEKMETT